MKLTYIEKKETDEQQTLANGATVKQFIATDVMVDTNERTVTATITTSAVDRFGEVVVSGGANLENFLKNPVVLWVHNSHDLPIGKALWLRKLKNKIVAKIQFAAKEVNEFAEQVFQMYKAGFLKAFSIGFRPDFDKTRAPNLEDIKKNPEWASAHRVFFGWELLEFSAVPVPANPEALASAVKNHDLSASPELLKQLGYKIEPDDDDEEVHYTTTETDPADTVYAKEIKDLVITTSLPIDVSADVEPILAKSFIVAEPIIEAKAAIRAKAFRNITEEMNNGVTEFIKRHTGKVYD